MALNYAMPDVLSWASSNSGTSALSCCHVNLSTASQMS